MTTPGAESVPGALRVATIQVKPGDALPIAGRPYTVEHIRRPDGTFAS